MRNKQWKPKLNIVSLCIYFFLLGYLSSFIKKLYQGQFETIDGWQILNLIIFFCLSYIVERACASIPVIVIYTSYMMSVGCLFAFVLSDVSVNFQTVMLYFLGAFFGAIIWHLIAHKWLI